ncbi:MAG: isoprenylcysteine carboxylmethyltransferase family protein [Candidatus Firestonebacteria bacterium]
MMLVLILTPKQPLKFLLDIFGFSFTIIILAWIIAEGLFLTITKSDNSLPTTDKKVLLIDKILNIVTIAIITISIFDYTRMQEISHKFWLINTTGIILIISCIILRYISIKTLGKFFQKDLTVENEQQLIKKGIYKIIRHPGYLAIILMLIGTALTFSSFWALLSAVVFSTIIILYRIKLEETALEIKFGQEYTDYKAHTYKLIPFIY